ncbi:hypothetical protein [Sphingomonas sp. AX6]|uniref:hypothetical protein n=1 Tax=Sphingomonas sp. AX6 TaxID=2653171 RepID=UPI0012EEFA0D|nr:hypothetical protein [Sphingomonas sp. AX6]VXC82469.1 hypothetical protein SPHINGOAX6_50275 [Sphingomonas sp. AX6]
MNAAFALTLLGAALLVAGMMWMIQRQATDPFAAFRERLSRQALTASPAAILTETLDAVTEKLGNPATDAWLWEPGGMVKMTARGAGGEFPMPEVNPWAGVGDASSPVAFLLTFGPAGMIRVGRGDYPARTQETAKALVPAVTSALEAAFLRQKQGEEIDALKARLDALERGSP